ncbi:MAG: hypothetical protein N838_16465 [Thiohalocapsa sp. PB-PSB1]|nr:MAG: hypothetical protein N838_14900 [Thiohalocapsa sp. PB-PSB1]QQO54692.1 MAG: hypothetical protein N838_16465 [Thiohalocapsa sp. PB-PSB1]
MISRAVDKAAVEAQMPLDDSSLEMEEALQQATNAIGCCISEETSKRFDTDGNPIDVERSHDPRVATSDIQNLTDRVGGIVMTSIAMTNEESWEYAMPAFKGPLAIFVFSLDGTMTWMPDSGEYREAMTGTLSFYDRLENPWKSSMA